MTAHSENKQATLPRFRKQTYEIGSQAPDFDEAALEVTRALIGLDFRAARATLDISEDVCRDYCNYMGSRNPLFLSQDYGRTSRWGGMLAPPTMVGVAITAPGLRGVQWIAGSRGWEWYRPIRPGDRIVQRGKYTGWEVKRGRHANTFAIQYGQLECHNEQRELVARGFVSYIRTARAGSRNAMRFEPRRKTWTPEEVQEFVEARRRETIRGAEIRYWEDVSVGDRIGPVVYGPLRLTDIALTGAFNDSGALHGEGLAHLGAHYYQLENRRRHPADSFLNEETGVHDHPHRGHWEPHMATQVGMPGMYDVGNQRATWFCRLVTDWMGDDAFVEQLNARLVRPNVVSDVNWVEGVVEAKEQGEHGPVVRCRLVARNQLDETTMDGVARVRLLSKEM
ncbi:FAS1-like dehydratase domain-containing protein [Actinophytocola sp.]|uniref:FAS1-like dehydratase domain-containing protein n=1 Tax=Actinophytocola sp. TaxID=1872138 RepID=UPI003D6A964D